MNYFDLHNRTAIVTGASSGIGRRAALAFAEAGANVILLARRMERLKDLEKEIDELYLNDNSAHRVSCVQCDVSDERSVDEAIESIKELHSVDILLNCAGTTAKSEDITTHTIEQWDNVIDTNLKGYYLVSRQVIPFMKKQNYGKIINIASISGMVGMSNQISYVASKGGVISMTRAMAVELGKYGITVNAISPGYILTEMCDPNSRGCKYFKSRSVNDSVGTPDDLVGALLLLASDASKCINGANIVIDNGVTANL